MQNLDQIKLRKHRSADFTEEPVRDDEFADVQGDLGHEEAEGERVGAAELEDDGAVQMCTGAWEPGAVDEFAGGESEGGGVQVVDDLFDEFDGEFGRGRGHCAGAVGLLDVQGGRVRRWSMKRGIVGS